MGDLAAATCHLVIKCDVNWTVLELTSKATGTRLWC